MCLYEYIRYISAFMKIIIDIIIQVYIMYINIKYIRCIYSLYIYTSILWLGALLIMHLNSAWKGCEGEVSTPNLVKLIENPGDINMILKNWHLFWVVIPFIQCLPGWLIISHPSCHQPTMHLGSTNHIGIHYIACTGKILEFSNPHHTSLIMV